MLTIILLITNMVFALDCTDIKSQNEVQEEQVITTDVPKHLKDAVIIVRTADGRESQVSANNFKVVPRKQQRLVTKVKEHTERTCKAGEKKNLLFVGGRRDHVDLDQSVVGKTGVVTSEKGPVLDINYMRKNLGNTPLGIGAGVDTNGVVRGMVGVEF